MENTQSLIYTSVLPNQEEHETNCIGEFQSEFFCIMHGASVNYSYIAARHAVDTATWGYKEIRKRQCYWIDKKQLLTRIIRTTNIALWQKHKEKQYAAGLYVDGVCCIIGQKTAWIGCFGDASVIELRKNKEQRLMGTVAGEGYNPKTKLGQDRYRFQVASATFPCEVGDTYICAVGSLAGLSKETLCDFQYAKDTHPVIKTTTGSVLVVQNIFTPH